jgi:hypothetical protein
VSASEQERAPAEQKHMTKPTNSHSFFRAAFSRDARRQLFISAAPVLRLSESGARTRTAHTYGGSR